ncbi:MAG: 4Fe-4S dicluster domain-containing protein, partial [Candidatus Micrarchaeia archaeon]
MADSKEQAPQAPSKSQWKDLKAGGLIKDKQKDLFTVRVMAPGGFITTRGLVKVAEIAKKYGKDYVHLSVRQSPEISGVHYKHFGDIRKELEDAGVRIASCGKRVRAVTACQGCTINPNGLVDTQKLSAQANDKFFGTDTPHKFKITFGGCPIDCVRARCADLGFHGVWHAKLIEEKCTSCTLCVKACQDKSLEMQGGKPVRDDLKCVHCGDCVKVCPFDAMLVEKIGLSMYAGGKHGKHPRQ